MATSLASAPRDVARRFWSSSRVLYAALILTLVFFAVVRYRLRNMPLERDEGEYAYMGQLILQGIPPFKLAANMKLPGTCMAYAVMMRAFGESAAGIRIGIMLVTTVSSFLVFLLGRRIGGEMTGAVAGMTHAFLCARPVSLGLDGHATHFVVLMSLAGILLLLRAIDGEVPATGWRSMGHLFASGVFFGIAFLMKQPGILFAIFGAAYWLWCQRKRRFAWRRVVTRGGAFVVGTVLPYALTCLWLWHAGVFGTFWFWTWSYAREYGTLQTFSRARELFKLSFPWAIRPFVLWEIVVVGLTTPLWTRRAREHWDFLLGFFLASVAAVIPGFYFRPHYYFVLLPAASLCVGMAVDCAQEELRNRYRRLAILPVLYFVCVYVVSVHSQWKQFFRLTPDSLSEKVFPDQPYSAAESVAALIKEKAGSGDQIGIIGSEPEICFYTRLHCASSYLYMYSLLERQAFATKMQEDFKSQLQRSQPRFLVYVDQERSWNWRANLEKNLSFFGWAWNFANSGYELTAQVPAPESPTLPSHMHGAAPTIYVFERREFSADRK